MLMAFVMWFLGLVGVQPDAEDFARYERDFNERGHHMTLDFGGQRVGGTRWTDDDFEKHPVVGIGYEYVVSRPYNGVGFEVLTQSLGKLFDGSGDDNYFFVGGGLAWYPIWHLRLFTQGGTYIDLDGNTEGVGRAGLGYRFMFFMVGMQPYIYAETTTNGQFGWAINFRFEFP